MKHCIIEDTSFIVATIDSNDSFHADAVNTFRELISRKSRIKIVIPPLAIYEAIIALTRKGVSHKKIEQVVMGLIHIDNVVVSSLSEFTAFKHSSLALTAKLRTHDFYIANMAMDYEAQILTFDKAMWTKIKPIYPKIYHCSSIGGIRDETSDFISDLDACI